MAIDFGVPGHPSDDGDDFDWFEVCLVVAGAVAVIAAAVSVIISAW